jgi:hypothetical protein
MRFLISLKASGVGSGSDFDFASDHQTRFILYCTKLIMTHPLIPMSQPAWQVSSSLTFSKSWGGWDSPISWCQCAMDNVTTPSTERACLEIYHTWLPIIIMILRWLIIVLQACAGHSSQRCEINPLVTDSRGGADSSDQWAEPCLSSELQLWRLSSWHLLTPYYGWQSQSSE